MEGPRSSAGKPVWAHVRVCGRVFSGDRVSNCRAPNSSSLVSECWVGGIGGGDE